MNKFLYVLSFFLLFSCNEESPVDNTGNDKPKTDTLSVEDTLEIDTLDIKSDYRMENVDLKERKEFKENLAQIEKKHGVQWNFCDCVGMNDSINNALQIPDLSDDKLDKLLDRLTTVEGKCQAFLVQNPNQTPEERARHENKVRNCLKAAK
jgi:hypothetical protein